MPRKTSQAGKKDTATESKNEGTAPRRSGRAVTKVEPSRKEASRSRRSSTAAQTAASVADSKSPKSRSSSRRDSTSPSDGRTRSTRESGGSPSARMRSARRNAGPVSYKESDGEEEAPTPKFDENFESGDDFEESESDEKSKPKGKARPVRAATKGRASKEKSGSRGRRGRPTARKSNADEEDSEEEVHVEDEDDDDETPNKKAEEESKEEVESTPPAKRSRSTPAKDKTPKEPPKSARGRRAKAEPVEIKPAAEEKPKPSRRSARSTSNKEEAPKKRPSRAVQAKKYTEEEEDEIEEPEEEKTEVEPDVSRKRKRNSTSEPSKRLKEDVTEKEPKDTEMEDTNKSKSETEEEKKDVPDSKAEVKDEKKVEKDESGDEPMEIDESEPVTVPEKEKKPEAAEEKVDSDIVNEENIDDKEDKENVLDAKQKLDASKKQESIDSSENLEDSIHSCDSEQGSRADMSVSSGLEDSQDAKGSKKEGATKESKPVVQESVKQQEIDLTSQSSESFEIIDENSEESKGLPPTPPPPEEKLDKIPESIKDEKVDGKTDSPKKDVVESVSKDNSVPAQETKSFAPDSVAPVTPVVPDASPASPVLHSKHAIVSEPAMNGPEKSSAVSNAAPVIHTNSESPAPKANGAHDDLHNNSLSSKSQYYTLPGRKYVVNSKVNENLRQSVKDKTFGFVSYNLTPSNSEVCLQKEKLLNELNTLDAHVICIQQVSKAFYSGALEPSLDALGFKGVFSQPEESLKGMATFYKTSLFKLNGQCETSLKHLIEKELETSSLDPSDRAAVKTHVKRCGNILLTNFSTLSEEDAITIANVQVPPTDLSIQTLQVSCLGREVFRINGGVNRPLLIGGELNMKESEAPYQLLRDGYLSNDMIEELMRRKDVILPGKENAALVNLLWKSYQHPSSNLSSCYKTVLEHEIFIPEKKITSPNLLWYSSDCLYTIGVLDVVSDKQTDHHFSLKADIAFFP